MESLNGTYGVAKARATSPAILLCGAGLENSALAARFMGAMTVAFGAAAISDQTTMSQRRLDADYYPMIARAVASLSTDTEEQRAALYERARRALLNHLQSMQPPFSDGEIAAELSAIEQAVRQVDASRGTRPQASKRLPKLEAPPAPQRSIAMGIAARVMRLAVIATGLYLTWFIFIRFLLGAAGSALGAVFIIASMGLGIFIILGVLPIWLVTLWQRRRRLRRAGLVKHRIREFSSRRSSPRDRIEIARALDDRTLMWAQFHPDHRPEAKQIAAEELVQRGYSRHDIENWQPEAAELTVPPAADKTMPRWWYRILSLQRAQWFRAVYCSAILIVLGLICVLVIDGQRARLMSSEFAPLVESTWPQKGGPGHLGTALVLLLVFSYLSLYGVGFLYRNRAVRILLLRPFGERRMTRALKRFVPRHLGDSSYVFTLSDRNYRPSILLTVLVHIPIQGLDAFFTLVLGPLLRNSTRIASVRNERKFRKLQKVLLRKFRPSAWSFIHGSQAFNIRSTDAWWQMCIHMLMHSCEVILVDLSKVKEGTA